MSLLSVLAVTEHIIYCFVALALIVPIVMLFVSAAMSMLQVSEAGVLQTVLAILDRVLLVFILVELLDTIRIIRREHRIIIAEPFLLVGLIAVVRRIFWSPLKPSKLKAKINFKGCSPNWGLWRAS
jgi:uncharacterized membrane protein (DUF373 family)